MSLPLVACLFVVLLIASLVNQALFLWIGGRLLKIERATFVRSLVASVLVQLGNAILFALICAFNDPGDLIVLLSVFILMLIVPWFCLAVYLRTSYMRAAGAFVIMIVGSGIFSLPLALSTRQWVCEAFIVPTGAMATTIFGAHSDIECPNCRCPYAVSMSEWGIAESPRPRVAVATKCPNCGRASRLSVSAPVLRGDRILVDKTVWPRRWDITVYRCPTDPSVNYVMRLVGLPNETLEIADGDVFIDGTILQKAPNEALDMWLFLHDTQHVPKETPPDGPRWQPEAAESRWTSDASGAWTFSGADAKAEALRFKGRITDYLAYNGVPEDEARQFGPEHGDHNRPDRDAVVTGDVKVECWVEEFSGDGRLQFYWAFDGRHVAASIWADGRVEITARSGATKIVHRGDAVENAATELRQEAARGNLSKPLAPGTRLAFAFRDGQAFVTENGAAVASLTVGPQDLAAAKARSRGSMFLGEPDPRPPCTVAIQAEKCELTLSRITLHKDVHYRSPGLLGERIPGEPDMQVARLGERQYFVLGDNSTRSRDSRFHGPVGADALIGVARWRYWPHHRWHEFR